jgi:SAM-dependent methyltransferase
MQRFWDERAREDPWYFVDNRVPYGEADLDAFWAGGRRDLDRILEDLGVAVAPGDTVVDVGCGVGRLTRALAGRAARVRALDVSGEMLALAREHNSHLDNVEWLQGDGESLAPIEDAGAGALVSHVVFQHIPDPRVTLGYVAEMGRVLRPGGWAAFQLSTDPAIHRRRPGAIARRLSRSGPRGQDDAAWLGSAVELDDLRATAEAAALDLQRVLNPGTQFTLVLARRR